MNYLIAYVSLRNCKKLRSYFRSLGEASAPGEYSYIIAVLGEQIKARRGNYAGNIFNLQLTNFERRAIASALEIMFKK